MKTHIHTIRFNVLLSFAFFTCLSQFLMAQTYCLKFDLSKNGTTVDLKLGLTASGSTFNLGSSNLQFRYKKAALISPTLISNTLKATGRYSGITLTEPTPRNLDGTGDAIVSFNLNFIGDAGEGLPISLVGTDLAVIRFQVQSDCETPNIRTYEAGTAGTVVFDDKAIPTYLSSSSNCVGINTAISTVSLGTIPAICAGAMAFTIPFTNSSATTTYSISGTGITSVTDATATANAINVNLSSAATAGSIPFTLKVKNANGCPESTLTGSVAINAPPTATISLNGASSFCQGGSSRLIASGGTSYAWSNGATTAEITVHESKTYTVTVSNSSGCTKVVSQNITVHPEPNATITLNGSSTICQGDGTRLTATGGTNYAWSTGATTAEIVATESKTYTVTVSNSNGCSKTAFQSITVNPSPIATLNLNGLSTFCQGGSSRLTATGGTNYAWSTGATTAEIVATESKTYVVTVSNGSGCTKILSQNITVHPVPNATIIVNGLSNFCQGGSTRLFATGGTIYAWSNGSTATEITATESKAYTVTVSNDKGCTKVATQNVTVYALPDARISGSNSFCPNGTTVLTASGGTKFQWSNLATTDNIRVNTEGVYTVTVTNENNCSALANITVRQSTSLQVSILGNRALCSGSSTLLTASGGESFRWSNGATTNQITVTQAGDYIVTATDAGSGCMGSATQTVVVSSAPIANINGSSEICENATTATALNATGGVSYKWSNGQNTATIAVSTAGTYTVTTTDANGCTATASKTVNAIKVNGKITVSGNSVLCAGESVKLTASGGTNYAWSTGSLSAEMLASESKTYTVTVITEGGCRQVVAQTIVVNPLPNAVLTPIGNTSFCQGNNVKLVASGGTNYLWSNNATSADITVTQAGNYSVLVTDANRCSKSVSQLITAYPLPDAKITGSNAFCTGSSTVLTATGGNKFQWSNGATTAEIRVNTEGGYLVTVTNENNCSAIAHITVKQGTALQVSIQGNKALCSGNSTVLTALGGDSFLWSTGATTPTITVSTTGNYSVTATDASGCTGSTTQAITTGQGPTVILSGSSEFCESSTGIVPIALEAKGGVSYKWSSGQNTASISVSNAGDYTVTVADANGCTTTATKTITVTKVVGKMEVIGNSPICSGDKITLRASGGTHYLWSPGGSTAEISVTPFVTTEYAVAVLKGSCTDFIRQTVQVKEKPNPVIEGLGELCESLNETSTTTLTAKGGNMFKWNTGETTPSITVNKSGDYTVSVTDNNGCTASTIKKVTINRIDSKITVNKSTICKGEQVKLTASGGTSYAWSNGLTGPEILVSPTATTEYTVTITANACTQTKKQIITLSPKPTADFEFFIVKNNTVKFVNTSVGANSYSWTFETGLISTQESPEIEFKNNGDHYVCLSAFVSETCGDVKCKLFKTTSIDELPKNLAVSVSPNPTTGLVNVEMAFHRPFRADEKLSVYDWLGRKVYEAANLSTSNLLDMGHLANGLYIFRATIEGKIYTLEKVVKM